MPSKRSNTLAQSSSHAHVLFFPLLILSLVLWVMYRNLFHFPIWFDETMGKAIFFGIPVWLYATIFGFQQIVDTLDSSKLRRGLLLGIAFGGTYGFAASLLALASRGGQVQTALLFASSKFWWEFFLSLMTAFWETLFFYSWIMLVIQDKFKKWSLLNQVLLTAAIFLVFHVPNTILRFELSQVAGQLLLLFLFAVGQALIFAKRHNAWALILSHSIWGMVLLVHYSW